MGADALGMGSGRPSVILAYGNRGPRHMTSWDFLLGVWIVNDGVERARTSCFSSVNLLKERAISL